MKDSPGVIVPPPFIYLIFFSVGIILEGRAHFLTLPLRFAAWTGLVVMILSLIIACFAFIQFFRARTTVMPSAASSALITTGIFRLSRNPLYLSLLVLYIGLTLFLDSIWPIILIPLLVIVMNRFVIAREEEYLSRTFGDAYRRYRERVRRWI